MLKHVHNQNRGTVATRAESKVPCARVRYVSDVGYVSKIQTRYTPSYDSQCNKLPVFFRKKPFCGFKGQTKIFVIFFDGLDKCHLSTKFRLEQTFWGIFFMKTAYNVKFSIFQEGEGTFPLITPLC